MADVVFVPDPAGWAHAFHSERGLLGSWMYDLTDEVADAIQFTAPGPGKPPVNRTGIYYGTGRTEASIGMSLHADGVSEIEGHVYAKPSYVKYVIHGTMPHMIFPKQPGGRLKFFWRRKGVSVSLPYVSHPGTIPNDFMSRGLRIGFRLGA
jgi:hypothetical protein